MKNKRKPTPPSDTTESVKTYKWRLKRLGGKEISKGVIRAKSLRSAKRLASIESGADKWGKKWLLEPAGHVKYDGDARSTYKSDRMDDYKEVEKILVLREVDDIVAHPTIEVKA